MKQGILVRSFHAAGGRLTSQLRITIGTDAENEALARRAARSSMMRLGTLGVVAVLGLAGCAIDPKVPRVYEGKLVEGPFVPPEAYSAYLRGVLAEEAGDLKSALGAYEETIREDDEDPEPFTRIGDVRCRIDPKDRAADEQFAQAAAIDAHYAPLLVARARCAAARGQDAQAIAWVDAVSRADRSEPSIEALWVSLSKTPAARDRVIALTVAAGEHVVAWDALIAWARTHNDAPLLAGRPVRAREARAAPRARRGGGRARAPRRRPDRPRAPRRGGDRGRAERERHPKRA